MSGSKNSFYLIKLYKMLVGDLLISKYSSYRKYSSTFRLVICKISYGNRSRMCSENHSFCLVNIPVISPSFFVNIRDTLDLTRGGKTILCYAGNIKSILHLPCRMVLRSE